MGIKVTQGVVNLVVEDSNLDEFRSALNKLCDELEDKNVDIAEITMENFTLEIDTDISQATFDFE